MGSKPKIEVLRRRGDFLDLSKNGRKIQATRWLVLNFKTNTLDKPRFGWTIPKQVGKAVLRNRLRRWAREVVRTQIGDLPSVDINVFFRPVGSDFYRDLEFRDFSKALLSALEAVRTRTVRRG